MDGVSSALLQQGLAGIGLIVMGYVVIRLYNDNQRLQREKNDLQESRLADAKETRDKVAEPLANISDTMKLLLDKIPSARKK